MRFAFSNIAWAQHDEPEIFALLRSHGIQGIEVAPTKVWPGWQGADPAAAKRYRERLEGEGFSVPALQAVLFDKPEAGLFDDAGEVALVRHLAKVAALAEGLGAATVVFGAPKQRQRGGMPPAAAIERAVRVLQELGKIFADHGTALAIEPNPRRYGCDFVINAAEAVELVAAAGSPGIALHLDSAAMFLEGDDLETLWPSVGPLLRHFHVSEPDLGDFVVPQAPHEKNLSLLERQGYGGWISVEMREPAASLAEVGPWRFIGKGR